MQTHQPTTITIRKSLTKTKTMKMPVYMKLSHMRGQSSNAIFLLLVPCLQSVNKATILQFAQTEYA